MLAILMAAGLFFASCGQQGVEAVEAALDVTPASLILDPQGGQEFVSIISSEDWLLRADVKWIRTVVSSGKASKEAVRASITYDANTSGVAREGVLTVKTLSGKTAEVKVSQDKHDGAVSQRGISTAEDLLAFAEAVNEGSSLTPFMENGTVVLVNDIDASSIKEWTPVGTKDNPFTGSFDGKGHVIKNINWSVDLSKYPDCGIIGYAQNANVTGLTVGAKGNTITLKGNSTYVNAGSVVGHLAGGSITGCDSYASLYYEGSATGTEVCLAGICGRSAGSVSECDNRADILSPIVCHAAGFVAYNEGKVAKCRNYGCILAEKSGEIGPAWACSYNKTSSDLTECVGRGHVGDYKTFKDNHEGADWDAYLNAVVSPAKEGYDMDEVDIDSSKESYLNWNEVKTMQLNEGVKFSHYDCINTPLKIHVLEVNLDSQGVEVTTSYANDCVPNPNGNKNSNNGFKIRETLSQLCNRKRSEGQNIIAGVNSGFFDSNDGISRGFHIEEGKPVYINNPYVFNALPNHSWGITVFTDKTASCGKKKFTGKLKVSDKEFSWHSMNDTIMRNVSKSYRINLYDSHYKRYPHASYTNLENKLAKNALYIVAEYVDESMGVNTGYAQAKVVSVSDGRTSPLSLAPYITSKNQVGISLSGSEAEEIFSMVSVGSVIEFRCDMTIEGETTRPIYTQNSSMFHMLKNGVNNLSSLPSNHNPTERDPKTFPVISQDKKTLWLVQVDGRQGWYSCGICPNEMMVLAKKLGGYNVTNIDGGGSSVMWVYDSAAGMGSVVNSVSDSKGERSCLNYLLIKAK